MSKGYMEIGEPWLSIIVTIAGILILSGWVQQLYKGYRTKSLKDISRYLLLLILAGAFLWLLYGIAVGDVFIIGTNLAAIALMLTVYIMKRRYDNDRKWTENISAA
ncbi:MAG: Sugar efflux transporter for intercellular exchange [Cenarchaeum symbiont of Oopsacas minuta]|nr:Sugar efflux transporter for intercellular exchange [Cenarchaeum symbiont of Oopsacas minuta]